MIINGKIIRAHTEVTENFGEAISVKTVKFIIEKWFYLPHVS